MEWNGMEMYIMGCVVHLCLTLPVLIQCYMYPWHLLQCAHSHFIHQFARFLSLGANVCTSCIILIVCVVYTKVLFWKIVLKPTQKENHGTRRSHALSLTHCSSLWSKKMVSYQQKIESLIVYMPPNFFGTVWWSWKNALMFFLYNKGSFIDIKQLNQDDTIILEPLLTYAYLEYI